jgi:hypothetical protein
VTKKYRDANIALVAAENRSREQRRLSTLTKRYADEIQTLLDGVERRNKTLSQPCLTTKTKVQFQAVRNGRNVTIDVTRVSKDVTTFIALMGDNEDPGMIVFERKHLTDSKAGKKARTYRYKTDGQRDILLYGINQSGQSAVDEKGVSIEK